jgi:DNA-binding phage protein
MAKSKTSPARDKSWSGKPRKLRPGAEVFPHDPTVRLRDPKFIKKAILEALEEGDYRAVVEIYQAHLRVLNRTRTAKALHVSRQSIHKMLKPANSPSLKTFTTFMKVLNAGARASA